MSYTLPNIEDDTVVFTQERTAKFALDNNFKPAAKPSMAKTKIYLNNNLWFTPWGSDNAWPNTILTALQGCAPAQVCIEMLVAIFYGNGLEVYKQDSTGKVTNVYDKRQQAWFRQSHMPQYLMQAATDYFTLANQSAQLIRNKNTEKPGWGCIANISQPWCRLSKFDNDIRRVPSVYIHGNWENRPLEEEVEKCLLINSQNAEDILDANKATKKFIWNVSNYTPGNIFYHEAPFHALVKNGTLDVFPEIPKIRKRKIKDSMFVKYHVRVNELYWYLKYGGAESGRSTWEGMKVEARQQIRAAFYTQIDQKLSGSDNAFKSMFTQSYTDRQGNEIKLITIEKIETEVGAQGTFDPDKQTMVADVFLAFGIPSAVANTVLSDSKSRGGGSDIKEGNTSIVVRMPIIRDNLLAPVDFAMRNTLVDGKPLLADDEYLGMDNTILANLDKSTNSTKPVSPTN